MAIDVVQDIVKYITMFGGSMMTIDATKDWLLGREWNMSDRKMDTFLRLVSVPKWQIYKGRRAMEAYDEAGFIGNMIEASGLVIPAAAASFRLIKDKNDEALEKTSYTEGTASILGIDTNIPASSIPYVKADSWRYVPLIGKDIWWTVGKGKSLQQKVVPKVTVPPHKRTRLKPRLKPRY